MATTPIPANAPVATRTFDAGHVLSITTGRLVCLGEQHPIDGVYRILGFLTGNDGLMTHQLPRAMDVVRPSLIAAFPETDLEARFGESVFDGLGPATVELWVADMVTRGVQPSYELTSVDIAGQFSDPIGDLTAMRPDAEIISVVVD